MCSITSFIASLMTAPPSRRAQVDLCGRGGQSSETFALVPGFRRGPPCLPRPSAARRVRRLRVNICLHMSRLVFCVISNWPFFARSRMMVANRIRAVPIFQIITKVRHDGHDGRPHLIGESPSTFSTSGGGDALLLRLRVFGMASFRGGSNSSSLPVSTFATNYFALAPQAALAPLVSGPLLVGCAWTFRGSLRLPPLLAPATSTRGSTYGTIFAGVSDRKTFYPGRQEDHGQSWRELTPLALQPYARVFPAAHCRSNPFGIAAPPAWRAKTMKSIKLRFVPHWSL